MARVALVVIVAAACSDPATVPADGAPEDAAQVDELVVSPVGFDFGSFDVGSTDPPTRYTFELANRGSAIATITDIAITGPAAGDYTIGTNDCGAMLEPAATCNVRVDFAATTAGDRDATLQITGSTSASAVLSGTGIAPPSRVRFYPSARNFGDVGRRSRSPSRTSRQPRRPSCRPSSDPTRTRSGSRRPTAPRSRSERPAR